MSKRKEMIVSFNQNISDLPPENIWWDVLQGETRFSVIFHTLKD